MNRFKPDQYRCKPEEKCAQSVLGKHRRVARPDRGRSPNSHSHFADRGLLASRVSRRLGRLLSLSLLTNWCKWGTTYSGILANGPRSITAWNLALDERGRPNIGPFACSGLVQIHSETKAITRTGLYWALVQHARAFRRGAAIVASHDANGELQPGSSSPETGIPYSATTSRVFHAAAKNPDGSMVLMLTNPGGAREVTVACGGHTAKVALTADSITTLRWN